MSPIQILRQFPLPPKPRVGDFGAGRGHYALILSEHLGKDGTIYAFDAFGPNLDAMKREASRHGSSFYALETDLNSHIPLRNNALNAAVVANTLFALTDRPRFLSELARVVEPGGRVLVTDWASSFKNMGPPQERVLSPGEAARLFKAAGFSVEDALPAGTQHFAFIATNLVP